MPISEVHGWPVSTSNLDVTRSKITLDSGANYMNLVDAIATTEESGAITLHTARTDNPHSTTATQVGAYTIAATDAAIAAAIEASLYGIRVTDAPYSAPTDGTTDATAAIQACLDANPGKIIVFPEGRYLVGRTYALGGPVLLTSTHDGTRLVFEPGGELVLAARATSSTYNYDDGTGAGAAFWTGLVLQDTTDITIDNLQYDGQRTLQPVSEFCHLVAVCGAQRTTVNSPRLREMRGDGFYITQSSPLSSTTNARFFWLYDFFARNEVADGRNAVSVAGCDDLHVDGFTSLNVGGVLLYSTAEVACTVSAAAEAVVSKTAHGLVDGTPISFTTTGTMPGGLSESKTGQIYYVIASGLGANSFKFSTRCGGTPVTTTTTGTGTLSYNTGTYVREPGGFDIEPNIANQSNKRIRLKNLNIIHEGTTGIAIHGRPAGTETTRDITIDGFTLTNTAYPDAADEYGAWTQSTGAGNFKLLWADDVRAVNGTARFTNCYGMGPIISDSVGCFVRMTARKCYSGAGIGNQTYDSTVVAGTRGVLRCDINIDVDDYARFGIWAGRLYNSTVSGRLSACKSTYWANRFGVLLSTGGFAGIVQTDVSFRVSMDGANLTKSIRADPGQTPTLTRVWMEDCDLGANDSTGWTDIAAQVGDAQVRRRNIKGVTNRAAIPSGGTWELNDFVKADVDGDVLGWIRTVAGASPSTAWRVVGLDNHTVLSANFTGTDVSTAQPVFGTAQDALTVAASTLYEFDAAYYITRSAGTTAHTTGVLFGGTATFTSIDYIVQVATTTSYGLNTTQHQMSVVATDTQITASSTSATEEIVVYLRGHFRISAAGTVIPQFKYSAAPGGAPTIKRGSFFRARPVGSSSFVTSGAWA